MFRMWLKMKINGALERISPANGEFMLYEWGLSKRVDVHVVQTYMVIGKLLRILIVTCFAANIYIFRMMKII